MKIFLFLKKHDLLWKQTPAAIFAFTSFTLYSCLIQTLSGVKEWRKVKDNPKTTVRTKAVKTQYKMDLMYIFS
jgi:hypothetical protein